MEKAVAPHSSTLAWKIPWTEEPGRLQSMGSLQIGHNWTTSLSLFTFMLWRRKWQPTPVFLSGVSQGRGSLVGCRLWGRTVGHNWSDLAAAAAYPVFWLPCFLAYCWLFPVFSSFQFSPVYSFQGEPIIRSLQLPQLPSVGIVTDKIIVFVHQTLLCISSFRCSFRKWGFGINRRWRSRCADCA